MRSLAVANNDFVLQMLPHESIEQIELEGVSLVCAWAANAPPGV